MKINTRTISLSIRLFIGSSGGGKHCQFIGLILSPPLDGIACSRCGCGNCVDVTSVLCRMRRRCVESFRACIGNIYALCAAEDDNAVTSARGWSAHNAIDQTRVTTERKSNRVKEMSMPINEYQLNHLFRDRGEIRIYFSHIKHRTEFKFDVLYRLCHACISECALIEPFINLVEYLQPIFHLGDTPLWLNYSRN